MDGYRLLMLLNRSLILFLCLISITASCASILKVDTTRHNGVRIEKEFIPFVEEFEYICNTKANVTILFAPSLPGRVLGRCEGMYMPSFLQTIRIDYQKWQNLSYLEKRVLILHELGHCVLNRRHNNNRIGKGIFSQPESIMYPYLEYSIVKNHKQLNYEEELCNN
jgi:hypothetical protein